MIKLTKTQKSSLSSSSFLRLARKARPVAVAKAPNAIDNDEFSSPVLGSAWLPRLCLGSFTSEVDSEALNEADTEALTEAEVERLAEVLNDVEALVLSEALKNADVEADSDTEADALDDADADVLADSDTDSLALCTSLNDTDSLAEIEALTEADCDSLNETLNDADSDSETLDDVLIEYEAMTLSISRLSSDRMAG